jgi:beta-lactamase regulating signal transducer with metallopeptidase domain
MQFSWVSSEEWLLRSALSGALILFLTWVLMGRTKQPAKQQRLAEWGMGAALCAAALSWLHPWTSFTVYGPTEITQKALEGASSPAPAEAPGGMLLPTDSPESPHSRLIDAPSSEAKPDVEWTMVLPEPLGSPINLESSDKVVSTEKLAADSQPRGLAKEAIPVQEKSIANTNEPWLDLSTVGRCLVVAYGLGALIFAARWMLGKLALRRLIWRAYSPPKRLTEMLIELCQVRQRAPRLLVSDSISVPLCFGMWNPTIILPGDMVKAGSEKILRWVLCHELTHLDRRDAWGGFLFNVGQVVYYYLPWFWHLRRQASLCQEYLADASAAQAETRLDYAQFLLGIIRKPALPAGATGVSGYSSDLFRRITMLLRSPLVLDHRVPRLWSLATGSCLLAAAILLSGVGLTVSAAPVDQPLVKKDEPKKDETKKDEAKKDETKKENAADAEKHSFNEIQQRLKDVQLERQKALDKMREEMEKLQADLRKNMIQFPGQMKAFNNMAGVAAMEGGYPGFFPHEGRLGVRVQKPSETLAEQLDLPKGQGLVIDQVSPDSAAAKAGLKPHDILLEIGGKAVPDNPADFIRKILSDIKADAKVDVVVLRKGKKETIKDVMVPEAKATGNAFGGGGFRIPAPNVNVPNINFPIIPEAVPPGFPGAGAGVGQGFGGGRILNNQPGFKGVMTTTFRNDDRFTTRHQEGSLIITVTGKIVDGKAKTTEIQVQDGTATNKYESTDKVPEQYRDKVKSLVEMSEKGSVKVEIKE